MRKICIVLIVSVSVGCFCNAAFGEFIVNEDGTVTDTSTGLMWQQETARAMTWEEALTYCEALSLGEHDDWRLPNINELQSIVDYSVYAPAIDKNAFLDTMSSDYWSSTTFNSYPFNAWRVNFSYGYVSSSDKSTTLYVRAVRVGL